MKTLFSDITLLDEQLMIQPHQYVVVEDNIIQHVGETKLAAAFDDIIDGKNKLLIPGFFNTHAHSPMTLMRGYGENRTLMQWLNQRIFPFEACLTPEDVYYGTLLGLAESMQTGIVSSTDMYFMAPSIADAVLDSGMKVNLAWPIVCTDTDKETALSALSSYQSAEALVQRYHHADADRVLVDLSLHAEYSSYPHVVRELAQIAKDEHLRMHIHLAETKEETEGCLARYGKTPVQYFYDLGVFDVPTTAAHCVWLTPEDMDVLAKTHVVVASCPVSNLKLGSGICDVPALYQKGIAVTIGTDGAASNNSLDFLEEIKFFATLHKRQDPLQASLKQVIYSATKGGALSQGRENTGLIKSGYLADLVMLDIDSPNMLPKHDLLANLIFSANSRNVVMTMIDGKIVYQNGAFKTIDIEKVKWEVTHRAQNIAAKLKG